MLLNEKFISYSLFNQYQDKTETEIEEKNTLLNFQLMNSNNIINILSFHRFFVSRKLNTISFLGFLISFTRIIRFFFFWKIAKLYRWQYFIGFSWLIFTLQNFIRLIFIEFVSFFWIIHLEIELRGLICVYSG